VPLEGGKPTPVINGASYSAAYSPAISPDGKWIAYKFIESPNEPTRLGVASFPAGLPSMSFGVPPSPLEFRILNGGYPDPPVRWSADGRTLTYVRTEGGVSNIWAQSLGVGRQDN
jgi:Tol biopolymer transport system component